jgi:cytochrome P450
MVDQSVRKTEGENLRVFSPQFNANPFPYLEQLRETAAVVPLQKAFGRQVWMVARYEEAVQVLKDQRFSVNARRAFTSPLARLMASSSRFDLSRSMVGVDEPDHSRLRSLVSQAFTPRYIDELQPRIQELADELLDRVQPRGEMDLVNDFAYPLPINVISEMLGIPPESRSRLREWSQAIAGANSFERGTVMRGRLNEFADYVEGLVAEKKRHPGEDLISQLVTIEKAGDRLSGAELLSMVTLLVFAGHETTSNLIGIGMLALFDHPDQLERLKAEPGLVPKAVEELLRFSGSVISPAPRFALADVEVGGQRIRKGDMLLVALASADRDPALFAEADRMDVGRAPNRHIAFGQGIHYCLGAPLARLEGQVAFTTLLRRMPEIRLNLPREAVQWRGGMSLRGLVSLPVAF